jgi:hypothetical protein
VRSHARVSLRPLASPFDTMHSSLCTTVLQTARAHVHDGCTGEEMNTRASSWACHVRSPFQPHQAKRSTGRSSSRAPGFPGWPQR